MPPLDFPRPEQISTDATSIDSDSLSDAAGSVSLSTDVTTNPQRSAITQTDIRIILFQLQMDLIQTLQPSLPPELRGNIESAVRTCVDSTLNKWAPIDSLSTPEPSLPARAESPCSDASSLDQGLLLALSQSHLLSNDFFGPKTLKPVPLTQPVKGSIAVHTTSPIPSHNYPEASSTPGRVAHTDRTERQSGRVKWDKYKDILCQLYVEENLPIQEVMKIMKERHGFSASVKQYRYQIGEKWRWKKYNGSAAKNRVRPSLVETTDEELPVIPSGPFSFGPGARGMSLGFDRSYDTSSSTFGNHTPGDIMPTLMPAHENGNAARPAERYGCIVKEMPREPKQYRPADLASVGS
ncbi:hypothetical protein O1611_g4265 [Lasiodiplodia mahajangana]|uniref:Uncharacterized protein n=1 Tax=Lasiodiplodia mahajangana TaxID=1108764 RepID=A0ACC2JPK9_9PEZI|nr:hypothetical protein O1611_g4265 [Lasiodiplodia mahajangana]